MTDQTKAALAAFKEHVLSVIASTEAKPHSSAVAAIDIDRFLAAHRTELAIKDGTWPAKWPSEPTGWFYRMRGDRMWRRTNTLEIFDGMAENGIDKKRWVIVPDYSTNKAR